VQPSGKAGIFSQGTTAATELSDMLVKGGYDPSLSAARNLGIALEDLATCRKLLADAGFPSPDGVNVSGALVTALAAIKRS
jgi:hypothetical protein